MKRTLLLISCAVLFCGCQANYYADKYKSAVAPGSERYLLPHSGAAEVVAVPAIDLAAETAKYERMGYVVIGVSKFKADTDDYSAALRAQALAVQADTVLSSSYPAGFRNDVTAMDQATPTINNMANAGGYINETGGRTPATSMASPSDMTNLVAPSMGGAVALTEYRAVFLRKRAVLCGANLEPLSGAQAMMEHAAHGLNVASVVDGSPAKEAGILPGDIVESVDGQAVADVDTYKRLINAKAGTTAHFTLNRKGEEMTVDVRLNPMPSGK